MMLSSSKPANISRGADRRQGRAVFDNAAADRRRAQFERRGTVPVARPLTRAQQLYGERRRHER